VNAEQLKVNDIDKMEKLDSWKKRNERSDDEVSESSGETYTSIFTSTRKIKTSVVSGINHVANAMREKLHSPPNQPYKKWDGGANEAQDGAVLSSRSLPVTSIDEPHEEHESRHQKSDDCDAANQDGTLAITEESKVDVTQDLTSVEDSPTLKVQVDSPGFVIESPTVTSKKTQWRSAVDPASGRTYYYLKGTSTVSWEQPVEFEQN
jgi:hypothetical protein